jgi:hypothetical protein
MTSASKAGRREGPRSGAAAVRGAMPQGRGRTRRDHCHERGAELPRDEPPPVLSGALAHPAKQGVSPRVRGGSDALSHADALRGQDIWRAASPGTALKDLTAPRHTGGRVGFAPVRGRGGGRSARSYGGTLRRCCCWSTHSAVRTPRPPPGPCSAAWVTKRIYLYPPPSITLSPSSDSSSHGVSILLPRSPQPKSL